MKKHIGAVAIASLAGMLLSGCSNITSAPTITPCDGSKDAIACIAEVENKTGVNLIEELKGAYNSTEHRENVDTYMSEQANYIACKAGIYDLYINYTTNYDAQVTPEAVFDKMQGTVIVETNDKGNHLVSVTPEHLEKLKHIDATHYGQVSGVAIAPVFREDINFSDIKATELVETAFASYEQGEFTEQLPEGFTPNNLEGEIGSC